MPLTTDLTSQLEAQAAIESKRNEHLLTINVKNAKLEALRMAKEIVMENHRTVPSGTAMTAGSITAVAESLETFLKS